MKRFALILVGLLAAVVVLPPLWFTLFGEPAPELPGPDHFVDLPGGTRMHVVDSGGTGQPIVLVHGLPGNARDWRDLAPRLEAAGHRVIAIDRIGYGHSSGRTDGDYSLRANTRDLLALLEALDLRDVAVVGWSYGGVVAMDAAVLDPSRIASIALVASGGPSSDDDAPPEAGAAVRFFYSVPVLRWRSRVPPLARGLMTVLSAQAFSDGPQPDWWLESLRANFARWETTYSYRGEILAPIETLLDLPAIAVPTLVIHGDDDRLAPVAIGRYLSDRIPGARYVEIEDGSHAIPITHAELIAEELLAAAVPRAPRSVPVPAPAEADPAEAEPGA